jgi:chemotaxis protein MotD
MVDIAIQSAPSGLDALSASRSPRSGKKDDSDRGFLQAMHGSGRDSRQSASSTKGDSDKTAASSASNADTDPSDGSKADAPAASATATDLNAAEEASMATSVAGSPADVKGPKIPVGLKTPPSFNGFPKSLLGLQKTTLVDQPQTPDANAPATATDTVPEGPAINPTDDLVQQLSVAVSDDQPVQATGDQTDATDPTKSVKAADNADDKATEAPVSDPSGAVSDVLSLLNVPPTNTAPVGIQTVAAAFAADDAQATAEPEPPLSKITTDKMANASDDVGSVATSTTAADGATQTFKLVRANGRSGSMDMSIGNGSDDTAQLDVKASVGSAGETITVLDSRRFLGLADGSNSAVVTSALSGDKEWAAAMRSNAALGSPDPAAATGKVVNTLKIQMNPIDLGLVTAHMRLSGDQLSVDLKVQSAEAYRQLSNDQGKMMDALRAQGYAVDRITVSMSPAASDAGDKQSQQGFQGQQSQQQSAANQGQGSEAQAKRQGYSGQQTNGNDSGRSSKDLAVDNGISGGSERGRSGSVYL